MLFKTGKTYSLLKLGDLVHKLSLYCSVYFHICLKFCRDILKGQSEKVSPHMCRLNRALNEVKEQDT